MKNLKYLMQMTLNTRNPGSDMAEVKSRTSETSLLDSDAYTLQVGGKFRVVIFQIRGVIVSRLFQPFLCLNCSLKLSLTAMFEKGLLVNPLWARQYWEGDRGLDWVTLRNGRISKPPACELKSDYSPSKIAYRTNRRFNLTNHAVADQIHIVLSANAELKNLVFDAPEHDR